MKRTRTLMLYATMVLITTAPRLAAEIIDLSVRLDWACAGSGTTGTGSGLLRLDTDAGTLSFDVSFAPTSAIMFSHIHGPIENGCGSGASGGIIHWFPGAEAAYVDTIAVTPEQAHDLIKGWYYINVHTNTFPDGEIREHIVLSQKNRFLTWHPGLVDDPRLDAGALLGLRVTIVELPDYPAAEGRTLWVGPPADFPEEDSSAPGLTFSGALLRCVSHVQDWSDARSVQITGGEIVPGAVYQIDLYDPACGNDTDAACFFGARTVRTAKFGDVTLPFAVGLGPDQPDFRDISAQVAKFLASPGAPTKATASLEPNTPKSSDATSFKTIATSVSAFLAIPYSSLPGIVGPCTCPAAVTCGTVCAIDLPCVPGLCINGQCVDQCGRCTAP